MASRADGVSGGRARLLPRARRDLARTAGGPAHAREYGCLANRPRPEDTPPRRGAIVQPRATRSNAVHLAAGRPGGYGRTVRHSTSVGSGDTPREFRPVVRARLWVWIPGGAAHAGQGTTLARSALPRLRPHLRHVRHLSPASGGRAAAATDAFRSLLLRRRPRKRTNHQD